MGLSESDTRAKLIDPVLHARGWGEDLIKREETAGAIEVVDGQPQKRRKGRIDYTLRLRITPDAQPVACALIEAKAEHLPPTHGLEQAKCYGACKRLNVAFVFSSNGHLFVEFDRLSGVTSKPRPLSEFPTPEELRSRYESAVGFRLDEPCARPLLVRYSGGEATRRYYQDAAIRAALEKIAQCARMDKPARVLLTLATGSGKTFIAVHLLRRIADAGLLRRALFVCDRDELRSQGLGAFQNAFGSEAAEVYAEPDGRNHARNARIHIGTYQTLDVDTEQGTANFLTTQYPEDYFSHIVIDECHRSAWGKWSQVLTRNPHAVQIGLTATPRQLREVTGRAAPKGKGYAATGEQADARIIADNLKHFGPPVYEYDMAQGIEDGYLAACEIVRRDIFLDGKGRSEQETGVERRDLRGKRLTDATTGEEVDAGTARERYDASSFEDTLLLPDRVQAMCVDLFNQLLASGGPEQKTIVFCARDRHADDVANALNNLYAAWCTANGQHRREPYAFKCTAAVTGAKYLSDLRGATRSHYVATTVDLLTTGVDVPCVRNIAFFKYVRSPIAFYQMVGRGTRLHPPTNKLMFRVYDYTNATRLFGQAFLTQFSARKPRKPVEEHEVEPAIQVEGFDVQVTPAGRYIVTQVDGQAMPVTVEEYKQRLAAELVREAPTLQAFRTRWISPLERSALLERLPDGGRSALLVQQLEGMRDYDLYDVLGELGYGLAPRTRGERAEAFGFKHAVWLGGLPPATRATLQAVVAQFAHSGTDGLENPHIFDTPDVRRAGGLAALKALGRPADVLAETKARMFSA